MHKDTWQLSTTKIEKYVVIGQCRDILLRLDTAGNGKNIEKILGVWTLQGTARHCRDT